MSNDRPDHGEIESRQVQVSDPRLSPLTKEMLTREAQEVVGDSEVRVPADRPHSAEGERPLAAGSPLNVTGARLMITIIGSALVVVAVVAILSGAGWWFLPIAVLALIVLLGCLVRLIFQMTAIREHASPTTTAAMEADGITNPDEFFSAIVDEFTEPTEGNVTEHRTVSAQDDPSRAAAEQRAAGTPTSGPSKATGP